MAFRIYVTDALKVIAENTAKQSGGYTMNIRYADMIKKDKVKPEKEETRTADEIIDHIKGKMKDLTGG